MNSGPWSLSQLRRDRSVIVAICQRLCPTQTRRTGGHTQIPMLDSTLRPEEPNDVRNSQIPRDRTGLQHKTSLQARQALSLLGSN